MKEKSAFRRFTDKLYGGIDLTWPGIILYAVGTAVFMLHTGNALGAALSLCVIPFLPGDAVKIVAAVLLTLPVKKAVKAIHNT